MFRTYIEGVPAAGMSFASAVRADIRRSYVDMHLVRAC